MERLLQDMAGAANNEGSAMQCQSSERRPAAGSDLLQPHASRLFMSIFSSPQQSTGIGMQRQGGSCWVGSPYRPQMLGNAMSLLHRGAASSGTPAMELQFYQLPP